MPVGENSGWRTIEGIRNLGENITNAIDLVRKRREEQAARDLEASKLKWLNDFQTRGQKIQAYPYLGLPAETVPVDMEHVEVPPTPAIPAVPAPPLTGITGAVAPIPEALIPKPPTVPAMPGIAGAIGTGVVPMPPVAPVTPAIPAKGAGMKEQLPKEIPGAYQVQQAAFDALSPEEQQKAIEFHAGQAKVKLPAVGPTAKPVNPKAGTGGVTDADVDTIANAFLHGEATPDMLKAGFGTAGFGVRAKVIARIKQIKPDFNLAQYTKDYIFGTGRQVMMMEMYQNSLLGDPESTDPDTKKGTIGVVTDMAKKIPTNPINFGGQSIALGNVAIRNLANYAGDPNVAAFLSARTTLVEEAAKLIMGGGTPTDRAQEMAESFIPIGATPKQIAASASALRGSIERQLTALKKKTLAGKSYEDFGINPPTEEEIPATQEDLIKIFDALKTQGGQ